MSKRSPSRAEVLTVLAGAACVFSGASGTWAQQNPGHAAAVVGPVVRKPWPGYGGFDWLLVVPAIAAVLAVLLAWRTRRRWQLSVLAGVLTLCWTISFSQAGQRYEILPPFEAMYVLTPQWYLSVAGGVLLLGNGLWRLAWVQLVRAIRPDRVDPNSVQKR
ncbi:hypothetical protein [Haloarchaeobius sp. DFWS5]|uniref:hypothetical protein n=1 Tax=Haloarchaeobius sp. DFWS5 TaxID=3446114 RepID=UPI003EB88E5B